ncbi:YwmB family TATA-box binding protein [Vallitalea okinawensis]|uniref:YwmB family TATA-box binding protein n=1 Tax=Vallitalea okinawensis TaxID=2078660 RepID=UPI000CFACB6B|nr:YwmB family TATA-box binding protein [Vallitalea okinawensis]
MKKKPIIASLLFIFLLFLGFQLITYATDERNMIDCYEDVEFQLERAEANIWIKLNEDTENYYGYTADKMCMMIAEQLGLEQPYQFNFIDSKNSTICTITKEAKSVTTEIQVQKFSNGNYYAIINYHIFDQFEAVESLMKKSEDVLRAFGGEPVSNHTLVGYSPGNLLENKSDLFKQIESYMDMRVVDELDSHEFYNAYGYSRHINKFIIFSGKKVNIDVAITYDDVRDQTLLYMGTPIINIEY